MLGGPSNDDALRMAFSKSVLTANVLSDLRTMTPTAGMRVALIGKTDVTDGLGGLYRWDDNVTGAEDTSFMNILVSSVTNVGRWVRVNQHVRTLPGGTLEAASGVKTYNTFVTTDTNGDATVYLTNDGTATGSALFSEVWEHWCSSNTPATTMAGAVFTSFKSMSADKRTMTYMVFRPNIGATVAPLAPFLSVLSGVTVQMGARGVCL